MEAKYVIVGGGIAGTSCAESISILDENESIILISSSPVVKTVSNITPLSKMLFELEVQENSHKSISSLYSSLNIIYDTVKHINSINKTIRTKSGTVIKYELLCICSGAIPKLILPDSKFVIGIRDIDSAKEFECKLKNAKRIVLVGNGGIATELVYEIEGVEIMWIIKDNHISSTFIDPGAAEFLKDRLCESEKRGLKNTFKRIRYTAESAASSCGAALGPDWHSRINLHSQGKKKNLEVEYNTEVEDIIFKNDDEWPVWVNLTNGKTFGCDFVVSATGVIPNSDFSFECGEKLNIAEDRGIKVDWKMETNIKDIFAAGDVCTATWDKADQWLQMRLWTQARQMGCYVGRSMVSRIKNEQLLQDFCFELFTHVTRFFGYKVVLLGLFNGQTLTDYEIILRVTRGEQYVKLILKNGKLQGAVLIGETDLEEMCENLILNQLDLSEYGESLLDPDIDIEDYFD